MRNKTIKNLELHAKAMGVNCVGYAIEKAKMAGQRGYSIFGVTECGKKVSIMSGLSFRQTQEL